MIEIKDVISVNYLQKFTGCMNEFNDKDLLELISGISKMFNTYAVIIHPNFKPFSSFVKVDPNEYKFVIDNITDYYSIKKLSNDIMIFNNDLMTYLISKKDRFSNVNVKLNYKKYVLDKLKQVKINDVFNQENYEIYTLIKKEKNLIYLSDLLIFFFKNYFYLLDKVINQINIYFNDTIIINKLFYYFDVGNYLLENEKINYNINYDDKLIDNYINKLDIYNTKKYERG